ncbi:NIPSNAP family protein [Curvivirga aplysinae]|uniref:NIPSNAP family protein n=1 Tax=Curvivirga aplysinae TaxID=2529852 RepID=UPI0012BBC7C0|nr:NIPSNAP family protein [Curvivirga aplysinae]MTI09585.1 NIPSNAP family protein [Curvivirga aplysinae]
MITCYVKYEVDIYKVDEFETYAKMWMPIVERLGGTHHGYFLPHESAGDLAVTLFSFPSLAAYEDYRIKAAEDEEAKAALDYADKTRCFHRFDREFLRPVFPE